MDLVIFTEEILNGKIHFLSSDLISENGFPMFSGRRESVHWERMN